MRQKVAWFRTTNFENISKYSILSSIYPAFRKTLNTSSFAKKRPVDFDDELKIGDVRYKHLTKITINVQLFWRLLYEV